MQIKIDKLKDIPNDIAFSQQLLSGNVELLQVKRAYADQEEFVFVLPGQIFGMPNFIRLVVCPPKHLLLEACQRLENFCNQHSI